MSQAKFGPGGNGELFSRSGGKNTYEIFDFLRRLGLDAYEYEAGNGVAAGEYTLRKIGEEARKCGIAMSLHTPYFISLSGVEEEKRLRSLEYIRKSLWASELIGADTIVIHSGSAAKISREEAMRLSVDTLHRVACEFADTKIKLGIETMGKVNQLGTLDEVIEQCRVSPLFVPVVDFGHLNAREAGGVFTSCDDYRRVFDKIGNTLGDEVARNLHCHFSKIEYTGAGEKKHLTLADNTYGPDPEPLMEAIAREGLAPRIISESAGTQIEDSIAMKKIYNNYMEA